MVKKQIRKFLPSFMAIDLTYENVKHIETAFFKGGPSSFTKVETINDLSPGGTVISHMHLIRREETLNYQVFDDYFSVISEEDTAALFKLSDNKIKKYQYHLLHEDGIDVYINRYTIGLITIDIDASKPWITLPEYCGKEVTKDPTYFEESISGMREVLKKDKKKSKKNNNDNATIEENSIPK